MDVDEVRFTLPRYTVASSSRYLSVPESTFRRWVDGYSYRAPGWDEARLAPAIVHTASDQRHHSRLAFVGLVEGMVINALKQAGLSLQALRRITRTLQTNFGDEWALASHRLTLFRWHRWRCRRSRGPVELRRVPW